MIHQPVLWMTGGAIALLAALGFFVFRSRRGNALGAAALDRVTRVGEALDRSLAAGFATGTGQYYKEFLDVFEKVRAFCESQRAEYQPLLDDMDNLGKTFAEIETELARSARLSEAGKP